MIKKIVLTLILLLIVAGGAFYFINSKDNYDASKYSAAVTSLVPGEKIDFTLPDQFDKAHTLGEDTKKLLFTFSKESSHLVRDFLQTQPKEFLSSRSALYIADISPMPTVIRNAFAMPDLKKSAYPVLLMYDGAIAAKFRDEAQKEAIMVVTLEKRVVISVKFANDAETLDALLK